MRSITVTLGLLLIALCHPSFAETSAPEPGAASAPTAAPTPDAADADSDLVMYQLYHPFELSCAPPDNVDATGITFSWLANGTALDASALKGRYKLAGGGSALQVERALEEDYGNYSCLVGGAAARRWRVHARPVLRLAPDHNVVEGQKLKLTCRVLGKPYPEVEWWFRAAGSPDNATALPLEGRVSAQPSAAGVPAGELLLAAAEAADAGEYSCRAPGAQPAATTVRVKDMYAALWPFLGICAEVFILCAIILVYEKRRTKPELDDSDTDHEQKKS